MPDESAAPSVFANATHAASALQAVGEPLSPLAPHLIQPLAAEGCHNPIFVSSAQERLRDNPADRQTAENLGALTADLLTQAAHDTGRKDILVKSVVWLDKRVGYFRIGMAAGTTAPDAVPFNDGNPFPAQAVIAQMKKLCSEMLGTPPDITSPHWEAVPISVGEEGLQMAHAWSQDSPRKRELYPLVKKLAELQQMRRIEKPNALLVQKDDLLTLIGREHGRGDISLA